jgi:predicted signal transduction protein with EAL and GGDEF domain
MDALALPCGFAGGDATVGASIGIALCPPLVNDTVELMRAADAAMYEAKRAGKGRVYFAPTGDMVKAARIAPRNAANA